MPSVGAVDGAAHEISVTHTDAATLGADDFSPQLRISDEARHRAVGAHALPLSTSRVETPEPIIVASSQTRELNREAETGYDGSRPTIPGQPATTAEHVPPPSVSLIETPKPADASLSRMRDHQVQDRGRESGGSENHPAPLGQMATAAEDLPPLSISRAGTPRSTKVPLSRTRDQRAQKSGGGTSYLMSSGQPAATAGHVISLSTSHLGTPRDVKFTKPREKEAESITTSKLGPKTDRGKQPNLTLRETPASFFSRSTTYPQEPFAGLREALSRSRLERTRKPVQSNPSASARMQDDRPPASMDQHIQRAVELLTRYLRNAPTQQRPAAWVTLLPSWR